MTIQEVIEDSETDYYSFDSSSENEEKEINTDTTGSTTTAIKTTEEASWTIKTGECDNGDDNDNDDNVLLNQEIERKRKGNNKNNDNKNPNALNSSPPSNSKSPWFLFCSEYRNKVINENPGLKGPAVQQKLAEIYYSLPESERERYRREARVYRDEINKKRHVRATNQRLPGNGYIQYIKFISPQIRAKHPEFDMKERNKLLAAGWKELGREGQQKYHKEAKLLREKFIKENPEYYAAHIKRSLAKRKATISGRKLEDEVKKEKKKVKL